MAFCSLWRSVRSGSVFSSRSPKAFTMVELLVTIAILSILVGMLLPAVQIARESGRRRACSNNIRQVGLATASYSDARRNSPGWRNVLQAYTTARATTDPTLACVSWTVQIMPFMEQDSVYQWYTSCTTATANEPPKVQIPAYRCPSQGGDPTTPFPLSYAVNAGTGGEVLNTASTPDSQFTGDGFCVDTVGNLVSTPTFDDSRPTYLPAQTIAKNGPADGRSMTMLLSERSGPNVPTDIAWSANPRAVKPNAGAVASNHTILHPIAIGNGSRLNVRVINPTEETRPVPAPVPANAKPEDWNFRYPSSRHPNGVNMVFCDSRTAFVLENIDPWVYCQLLSSDSGSVSGVVANWQQRVDDAGQLRPYTLNPADLVK